jgi:hypothetical protein
MSFWLYFFQFFIVSLLRNLIKTCLLITTIDEAPVGLSLEEFIVHVLYINEVLMEVEDNCVLIVGDPQEVIVQ